MATTPRSGPERQTHTGRWQPTIGSLLVRPLLDRTPDRIVSLAALTDIVAGLARVVHLWTPQLDEHPCQRSSLRMITTPEYDVWMIRWPPATSVTPHDHSRSAGAFAVASGALGSCAGPERCHKRRWSRRARPSRSRGAPCMT